MRSHKVSGGGGVRLHVDEAGVREGRPILFIHGFSQSRLTWRRQMESELARRYRLLAMDLRGHGLSDKPQDAYGDARLWAEDIDAVIRSLGLDRPVLVAWSYAGFIVCDYMSAFGEGAIGGINLVGAATSISQDSAPRILGMDFLSLLPGLFSDGAEESVRTLEAFIAMCARTQPDWSELCTTLGYNSLVPPYVRREMLSRTIDNDALLPALRLPVLISHGEKDRIVLPEVARAHAAAIGQARLSMYPDSGHAVFIDDCDRFNKELGEFALLS